MVFIVTHGTYELKFHLHKTCILRPGCHLNTLYKFNLDLMSTGKLPSKLFETQLFLKFLEQLLIIEDKSGFVIMY